MKKPMMGIAVDDVDGKKFKICELIANSVNGTFSHACKAVGISRPLGYEWMAADPQFKIDVDKARAKARESGLDFVETKLMAAIRAGNITSILFFLKCMGRERGWIDKVDMDLKTTSTTNITVVHDATQQLREMLVASANAKAIGHAIPITLDQPSAAEPDNTTG